MNCRDLPRVSGVYQILNTKNENFYIGSSNCVRKRCMDHFRELKNGNHCNSKLQNSWNKYGEKCFTFNIIEECPIDILLEREQFYMDSMQPFFNINPCSTGGNGSKRTSEQKEALSARMRSLWSDPENYERLIAIFNKTKEDPEVRRKQSEAALVRFRNDSTQAKNHSKVMKEKFADPEYKARVRAAMVAGTDYEK